MRNVILMMLLAAVSSSAMAEWVKVGRIERYTAYADPSTIRKDGNIVKMWVLTDYKTPQSVAGIKPFMSTKVQDEYDCNEEQERILYLSFHSGNMGGDVVYSESTPDAKWHPVPPDSMANSMWKFACGKANGNEQEDAAKTLDGLQPDWRQITDSTAFRNWMTTLPKDEQDKLNGSWEPYYIADKITEFKKSTAVGSSNAESEWVKVSSTIFIGEKSNRGNMLLSGEIRPGDAEIVASSLGKNTILRLQLNSMGGDVAEAMKIVSLVKGAHLTTKVAPDGFCASACFFLYLAGDSRAAAVANDDGKLPKQRYDGMGYVGIHRPYLKAPSGDQASIKRQEEIMRKVRSYLVSEGVSQHLIDEMMIRPSNDIYWLSAHDLDDVVGEYSAGKEEVLISKCGYKRISKQISEKWTDEQAKRLTECEVDYWEENIFPVHQQFIAKLRTGWRPWKKK